MSYLVLARKWRPSTFDEVVGQDHVTRTLKNALDRDRVAHALLFTGSRGIGKTSCARILAKSLNCINGPTTTPCGVCPACVEIGAGTSVDVFEVDGASNNSVEQIREIRESVKFLPTRGKRKMYIIDEVHMLTTSAFNALLKTLEEPPEHVLFVFATTEPHKIPDTIISRCQRFDFKRVSERDIVGALTRIADAEKITIDAESLHHIAREAKGGMRDSLSLFDQVIAFCGNSIDEVGTREVLGIADRKVLHELTAAVLAGDGSAALDVVDSLFRFGLDLQKFAAEFVKHLRDLMVIRVCEHPERLVDLPPTELTTLAEQVSAVDPARIHRMFNALLQGAEEVARSPFPKLVFEMTLLRLCNQGATLPLAQVLRGLGRLEAKLGQTVPDGPSSGSGSGSSGGAGGSSTSPSNATSSSGAPSSQAGPSASQAGPSASQAGASASQAGPPASVPVAPAPVPQTPPANPNPWGAPGGDPSATTAQNPSSDGRLGVAPRSEPSAPNAPQAVAPQAVAPQVVAPQAVAPQAVAPQAVAPQAVAPQAVAPQAVAPQAAAPQAAAPSMGGGPRAGVPVLSGSPDVPTSPDTPAMRRAANGLLLPSLEPWPTSVAWGSPSPSPVRLVNPDTPPFTPDEAPQSAPAPAVEQAPKPAQSSEVTPARTPAAIETADDGDPGPVEEPLRALDLGDGRTTMDHYDHLLAQMAVRSAFMAGEISTDGHLVALGEGRLHIALPAFRAESLREAFAPLKAVVAEVAPDLTDLEFLFCERGDDRLTGETLVDWRRAQARARREARREAARNDPAVAATILAFNAEVLDIDPQ